MRFIEGGCRTRFRRARPPRHAARHRGGHTKTAAVVNPKSAGGKTARQWPETGRRLAERLGPVTTRFTERTGHATQIARELLNEGYLRIIAAGGDGTINEVANGFLDGAGASVEPAAVLGILPLGTGGDFRRTLGIELRDAVDVLAAGAARRIDMGKARYLAHDGAMRSRYFINLTSFGMGGDVASRSHNFLSPVSGKAAFLWATLETLFRYRRKRVQLTLDDGLGSHSFPITNVAVGNGRYHGGGMHVCPKARLDDGLLEVTVIEYLRAPELCFHIRVLYSDNLYLHPKARHFRAARILAEAGETVRIEIDGEPLGTLPLEISVLPGAISVIAPPDAP